MKQNKLMLMLLGVFFFSLASLSFVSALSWSDNTFNNSLIEESLAFPEKFEYYETGADTANVIFNVLWSGQSFTPGTILTEPYLAGGAEIHIKRVGSISNVTVSITNVDGDGKPTGSDLTNGTILNSSIGTGFAWHTVSFSPIIELSEGTQYALVIHITGGGSSNNIEWSRDNAGSYAGGQYLDSVDSGATWTNNSAIDYYFRISRFDITRYLEIPSGVSALTNAFLSFSGYNTTDSYPSNIYIEIGTPDGTHEWEYTGEFNLSTDDTEDAGWYNNVSGEGEFVNIGNCYDEDLSTRGGIDMVGAAGSGAADYGYVYENYTIPSGASNAQVTFKFRIANENACESDFTYYCYDGSGWDSLFTYSGGNENVQAETETIPSACLSGSELQIRTRLLVQDSTGSPNCDGDDTMRSEYYEGYVTWSNRTSNLYPAINSYLSGCSIVNGYCLVPFLFHSDTIGVLQYLDLLFNNIGFLENSQTWNNITYESAQETYVLNLSYDSTEYTTSTANIVYNGTSYAGTKEGTGNTITFSKTLTIDAVTSQQNKSFYWEVILTNSSGANYFNSTWQNQTVNLASISLCGGAGGSVVYLNFTFKDESDSSVMNASNDLADFTYWISGGSVTQSYIITNSTENPSYAFCFTPPDTDVIVDLTFKYSASGYPLRTFQYDDQTLTNASTNQVLYLLGSSDGIYSTVQSTEVTGTPISGVSMIMERQFDGVWIIIGQGVTGSDGMMTFWVNPNFEHRITSTKNGYVTSQVTITPSQALYTLIMSKTTGDAEFSGSLEGMSWYTKPPSGYLAPGTYYFTFNLTANLGNLDGGYCKFELVNGTHDIVDSTTGGNASGCNLGISYTHIAGELLYGKLYVDTTNTTGYILIDSDQRWVDIEGTDVSTWSTLYSFFTELKDLDEWGEGTHRQEWNRTVTFFLFLTIALGLFSYFTQWDAQYPGAAVLVILIIIMIASFSGWFYLGNASLIEAGYDKIDKYVIAMLTFSFSVAWYISHLKRIT